MDKDKALRRGLWWLGLAIIAAIMSGLAEVDWIRFVWFFVVVLAAFMAYIYLMWEG